MDIRNFASNFFKTDSSKTVTIKSGRYEHVFPYSEVKGLTVREVASKAAKFLHIDATKLSRAEKLISVAPDSVVEGDSTYQVDTRIEKIDLGEEVIEDGVYGVDVEYGTKG